MKRLTPPVRIAFCLACLSINVLLIAQILGFLPGSSVGEKKQLALRSALADRLVDLVGAEQPDKLKEGTQAIVRSFPEVISMRLLRADGSLAAEAKAAEDVGQGSEKQSLEQTLIPIVLGQQVWGQAEVGYRLEQPQGWWSLLTHPLFALIAFVSSLTFLVSLAYVRTAFWQMDPTMVVPDHVRNALDALAEGLLLLDNNRKVAYANQAFADIVEESPQRLKGLDLNNLDWVPVQGRSVRELPWESTDTHGRSDGVLGLRDQSGQLRTFLVKCSMVVDQDDERRGLLVSFDDVTALEKKKAELSEMLQTLKQLKQTGEEFCRRNEELEILATQDPLTACMNRRAFFSEYETQWGASERYGHPLSFIMVDIDHFKSVNDQYGHSVGDRVIAEVAQTLRDTVRDFDVVCRYGGEEFCILLPHVDLAGAVRAAERCRGFIEGLRLDPGVAVTASMGVSARELGAKNTQEMLEQADECMYMAKRNGRNRVVCWTELPEDIKQGKSELSRRKSEDRSEDVPIPFHAVAALISALHFRDPETADHCRRVADLCVATAAGKMTESERYLLEIAALLHDIGKLGVPESILMKEAPLTDEEWRLMRTHVLIGIEIIATSLGSPKLTEIVGAHHAWYGGNPKAKGTPMGDEIPLASRILSIADAYDSMVSDRPYRKGMSRDDAFGELRRCTQSQFDPELVEDFIRTVLDQDEARRDPLDKVSKKAALHIGLQMEKLVCALDAEDTITLCKMASQLRVMANETGIAPIARAATQLESAVSYDPDWKLISKLTNELLEICRATQHSYLHASEGIASIAG